jgi:hypothetical protein
MILFQPLKDAVTTKRQGRLRALRAKTVHLGGKLIGNIAEMEL